RAQEVAVERAPAEAARDAAHAQGRRRSILVHEQPPLVLCCTQRAVHLRAQGADNMERYLGRFSEQIYAILRIVVGLAFSMHGMQKLLGLFGRQWMSPVSFFCVGGVFEVVGCLFM